MATSIGRVRPKMAARNGRRSSGLSMMFNARTSWPGKCVEAGANAHAALPKNRGPLRGPRRYCSWLTSGGVPACGAVGFGTRSRRSPSGGGRRNGSLRDRRCGWIGQLRFPWSWCRPFSVRRELRFHLDACSAVADGQVLAGLEAQGHLVEGGGEDA